MMAAPGESRLRDKVKAAWQETDKSVQEVIKRGGRYCMSKYRYKRWLASRR